jgi:hypothetical protein
MIHRTDIARCIAVAFALALAGCGHGEDAALTESAVQVAGLSHRASRAERLAAKKPKKPKKHGSAPVEPPPPVVASLVLTDAPATGMPAQAHADFSLSDARELFVYSVWSNLEGEHTQLVKLYSPDGELYYQKLVAFSTLIDSPRAFTTWQDVPHEQTVQPVAPHEDGELVVRDYIGLAGSEIADHGMTGPWQVEVYLDDALVPTASSGFNLTN